MLTRISRRGLLGWLAMGGAGALLGACSPTPTPQIPTPKIIEKEVTKVVQGTPQIVKETVVVKPTQVTQAVTIDWWFGWGGLGASGMKACARMLEEREPGIKVNVLPGVSPDKAMVAIAGGTPPDALIVWGYLAPGFMAKGAFLPVTEMLNKSTVVNKADFPEASWSECIWHGQYYGVPAVEHGPTMGFVFNVDLVKAAGLDPATPMPLTWDDVYTWHKATTKLDAKGNLSVLGYDPASTQYSDLEWWIGDWFEENALKFTLDKTETVQWLTFYKKVVDLAGGPEKVAAFTQVYGSGVGVTSMFPSGFNAMMSSGYYVPGELAHTAPKLNTLYTWIPQWSQYKGRKVAGPNTDHQINIPKGAKHPAEAFKLLEFMTTDAALNTMFELTGWMVTKLPWMKTLNVSAYKGLDFFVGSLTKADMVIKRMKCPMQGFVRDRALAAVNAVCFGKETPEQASKSLQADCVAELEKQKPTWTV